MTRTRSKLVAVIAVLLVGSLAPVALPASPAAAATTYTFGKVPLDDAVFWAGQKATCGLTTNQLAAIMLAPTYPETGASGSAAPSPMTLSRYDTGAGLYAFGSKSTSYPKAFWHPGVGAWAFDSAGGWNLSGADAMSTDTAARQAATTMAARWCSSSGTDAQRRQAVWSPWFGCTSGVCETIYNAIYDPTALKVAVDVGVGRLGGGEVRSCRTSAGTFPCTYVDPARAQGYKGWAIPAFGPSPVSAPFYVISANGVEQRWWISQDSGYDTTIVASKPVTANARTALTWSAASYFCDVGTGKGTCDWSSWQPTGGSFVGSPAVAANADGRLEVFAGDAAGGVFHSWQVAPNGSWSAWQPIGGRSGLAGPVAGRNADGRLEVFATAPDQIVWHSWVGALGIWSAWMPLGGSVDASLTIDTNADGRLELYGVDPSGTVQHRWQLVPNGDWAPQWYPMPGAAVSGIDVGRNADQRLEIVARTRAGALTHAWQVAPNAWWTGWSGMGGSVAGRPRMASNLDGRLEVFARGTSGDLVHAWQTRPNGLWGAAMSLGGQLATDPLVAKNRDGRLEVFSRSTDGSVDHSWQVAPNSGWSVWVSFAGVAPGGLAVSNNADGHLVLFGIASDGVLHRNLQL